MVIYNWHANLADPTCIQIKKIKKGVNLRLKNVYIIVSGFIVSVNVDSPSFYFTFLGSIKQSMSFHWKSVDQWLQCKVFYDYM